MSTSNGEGSNNILFGLEKYSSGIFKIQLHYMYEGAGLMLRRHIEQNHRLKRNFIYLDI